MVPIATSAELAIHLTAKDDASRVLGQAEKNASGLGKTLGGVATVASGFVVGQGLLRLPGLFTDAVSAGSNLNESLNAVNQIFDDSAQTILDWGRNNATSFGLSQRAFNDLVVPLGAGLKNAGLSMEDVTGHSIELTKRAADMASVFNTDVGEALAAIQAGLRGEADPLERFGVGLSAAKVEAAALAMTGKTVAASLTDQEKMLARVNLIMRQTSDTAGDFTSTSDGAANSARIAAARQEELAAVIGTKLLPVQRAITAAKLRFMEVIANFVLPALTALIGTLQGPLSTAFALVRDGVLTFIQAFQGDWTDDTRINGLHRAIGLVATAIGDVTRAFQAGGVIGLFRELGSVAVGAFTSIDWSGIASSAASGLLDALSRVSGLSFDAGTWLLGLMTGVDWNRTARTVGQSLLDGLATAGGWVWDADKWVKDRFADTDWTSAAQEMWTGILNALKGLTNVGTDVAAFVAGAITGVKWADVARILIDGIVTDFNTVADFGQRFADWVRGQLESVDWQGAAQAVTDGILAGIDTVTDWGQRFATWIQAQVDEQDWSGVAQSISDGISGALADAQGDSGAGGFFANLFGDVAAAVAPVIEALTPAIEFFNRQLGPSLENLREAWQGVKDAFAEMDTEPVLEALRNIATVIVGVVIVAIIGLSLAMRGLTEVISVTFPIAAKLWVGAIETASAIVNAHAEAVRIAWGAIQFVTDEVFPAVASVIQTAMSTAQTAVETALGAIRTAFDTIFVPVQGVVQDVMTTITGLIEPVMTTIQTVIGTMLTEWNRVWGEVKETIDFLWNGVDGAVSLIQTGYDTITGIFSDVYNTFFDYGTSIKDGLMDGLGPIVDTVSGIVDGIIEQWEKIPGFLRPGSPSKWATEMGKSLTDGLVGGMESGLPMLERAVGVVISTIASLGVSTQATRDTGIAVVTGIATGIVAGGSAVGNAIERVVGNSAEGARDAGLAIGRQIGEGVADGIGSVRIPIVVPGPGGPFGGPAFTPPVGSAPGIGGAGGQGTGRGDEIEEAAEDIEGVGTASRSAGKSLGMMSRETERMTRAASEAASAMTDVAESAARTVRRRGGGNGPLPIGNDDPLGLGALDRLLGPIMGAAGFTVNFENIFREALIRKYSGAGGREHGIAVLEGMEARRRYELAHPGEPSLHERKYSAHLAGQRPINLYLSPSDAAPVARWVTGEISDSARRSPSMIGSA